VVARGTRQRQRGARRHDVEPLLGVEHVGGAEQVALVGPAAVVENEQAGGVAGGRPLADDQIAHSPTFAVRRAARGPTTCARGPAHRPRCRCIPTS
jgi:hypothetical protein